MTIDRYTRGVLTVIAVALVYLCVVLTPWPSVRAQTALRPGDSTGPAEMVIVGWRLPRDAKLPGLPVQIVDSVPLSADVRVVGDVRVGGVVQTQPARDSVTRVVVAGWEERAAPNRTGQFRSLDTVAGDRVRGVPVSPLDPR